MIGGVVGGVVIREGKKKSDMASGWMVVVVVEF